MRYSCHGVRQGPATQGKAQKSRRRGKEEEERSKAICGLQMPINLTSKKGEQRKHFLISESDAAINGDDTIVGASWLRLWTTRSRRATSLSRVCLSYISWPADGAKRQPGIEDMLHYTSNWPNYFSNDIRLTLFCGSRWHLYYWHLCLMFIVIVVHR